MKVLWFVNILLPKPAAAFGLPGSNAGGWLVGQLECLKTDSSIELSVVCLDSNIARVQSCQIEGITYWVLPTHKPDYSALLKVVQPDLLQLHGTEQVHALPMLAAMGAERTLVTIQGLAAQVAKQYFAGIPRRYQRHKPFKQLAAQMLMGDVVAAGQRQMALAGERENVLLHRAKYVSGRTSWDKGCVLSVNPDLTYFHSGEILRPVFYEETSWHAADCQRYSIFVSQATYPIKGLHLLLLQLPRLLDTYPDIHLYVGGRAPYVGYRPPLQAGIDFLFEYQAYLKKLLRQLKLEQHVTFLGNLTEMQMRDAYLRANVFVQCSSIENSPNSLGEAMMLGVPCVASAVGGVGDMIENGAEGILYPFGQEHKLTDAIDLIFRDVNLAKQMGENARRHAQQTHSRQQVTADLLTAYQAIMAHGCPLC